MNLAAPGEELRPIFISANLLNDMKQALLVLFQNFKDVFAWTYGQIPGVELRWSYINAISRKDVSDQTSTEELHTSVRET